MKSIFPYKQLLSSIATFVVGTIPYMNFHELTVACNSRCYGQWRLVN
jgi:hypothetical protein